MNRIVLAVLAWVVLTAPAHAQHAHMKKLPQTASGVASAPAQTEDDYMAAIKLETRYGAVQYRKHGSDILVNGVPVAYQDDGIDLLENRGIFRLSNEDVVLFEGPNLGSGGIPGLTFFLVLKPNEPPQIIDAQISPLENPVDKVWQKNDVIYVKFKVNEYTVVKPTMRFASDQVIFDEITPPLYKNSGPRLTDGDCDSLYRISMESCSKKHTEYNEDCAKSANAAGGIGDYLSAIGTFNDLSRLPGFNEKEFDRSCLTWCKGGKVAYEKFSNAVCNIK